MNDFKFKIPINIRFSDFDLIGHVNNAVYLTYLEEARIRYFEQVISEEKIDWQQDGMILAKMVIDFKLPITGYLNYFVSARVSRIGTKSFDFTYQIIRIENERTTVYAEAMSVMVCYDYNQNRSVKMRDDWRKKVEAFEGNI